MRRPRPSSMRALLLPTLSGVLYFLSWIGFGVWPLAFFCFLPLLWSLRGATLKQAFLRGWWMGFVTHLGGYPWLIHLLSVFAGAPLPLAFVGYLLLCAAQGLIFAAMGLGYAWLRGRTRWSCAAVLPVSLAASEFCVPLLFQSYTGVALMPILPLVQIADLGGPILLSALQAMVNGALFDGLVAYRERMAAPLREMAFSILLLLASGAYGFYRIAHIDERQAAAPHVRIGLAQPNVGELELHQNPNASVRALRDETAEISARGAAIAVWPEVGFNTHPVAANATDGRSIGGGIPIALIAGVLRVSPRAPSAGGEPAIDQWNSAIAIDPKGAIAGHYDKIQLLAFGEYIPFGDWFPSIYDRLQLVGHLSRGTTTKPLSLLGYRFATFICYEDILPGIVRDIMRDHGEGRAHAMVNLTNDSWYGVGHEQEEHLMLAAVRSIEHRRWLLRATSTGISAFVDAAGRVVQRIGRDQRGVAVGDVPMLQGQTLFEVLGMWPGWAALACFAFALLRRKPAQLPDSGRPRSAPR